MLMTLVNNKNPELRQLMQQDYWYNLQTGYALIIYLSTSTKLSQYYFPYPNNFRFQTILDQNMVEQREKIKHIGVICFINFILQK